MSLFGKLLRDVRATPGRTLIFVLSLTLGLTGFFAVSGAFGVLSREIARAYQETLPASATLKFADVTPQVLRAATASENIQAASRRRTAQGRFRTSPGAPAQPAILFVIDDFTEMPLALLKPERGERVPPTGTMLVERSAVEVLGRGLGESALLSVPGGPPVSLRVSGIVHEAALAPARTHQSLYAYISRETADQLGIAPGFDELRILAAPSVAGDSGALEQLVRSLVPVLQQHGSGRAHALLVPPPGQHPHHTQMMTVLTMLWIFSVLVLLMSSLVTAKLLQSLLARQAREIAIMKTLGGTPLALAASYLLFISALCALALGLALPLGTLGARAWARGVGDLLNFDLANLTPPLWVFTVELGVGLLVPLLLSLPAILRAVRRPVIEVLADHGLPAPSRRGLFVLGLVARAPGGLLTYALRGVLRDSRRFVLSLLLLAVSGGLFIGARGLTAGWSVWTAELGRTHRYDVEVELVGTAAADLAARALLALPTVEALEVWGETTAAISTPGAMAIAHSYPDEAHGTLHVVAPPEDFRMFDVQLMAGRFLRPGETGAVVVNQMVPGARRARLGDTLALSIGGREQSFRVVGKVREVGVGAIAYVSSADLGERALSLLRVRKTPDVSQAELSRGIDQKLTEIGAPVLGVVPLALFQNAMVAHLEVLVGALLSLSLLCGLVGALGLGATLSLRALTRGREFSVLRALGAVSSQIALLVAAEGAVAALLSIPLSLALGVLLTQVVGSVVGQMSFGLPLPFTFSASAAATAIGMAFVLVFLASLGPARRAAGGTVKEGLDTL